MSELSAVPFSALPPASDGYTVLYENDQVCRSDKKLSELVGSRTSSFLTKDQGDSLYQEKGNYLVPDDLDEYATQTWVENEISKIGSYVIVNETTGEDNHPVVENPSTKVIYLTKQTEGKFDNYNEWIYKDDTDVFECIGETTLDLENYYKKTETSGKEEIEAALEEKQDKLTFAGENNTITSINNSAVGGGSTGTSNSWKQLSEEHGSSGTLDNDNFCVYLGAENSSFNDSYTLGRNNYSEQGLNIGYNNKIDINDADSLGYPGTFNIGKSNCTIGKPGAVNIGQCNSAQAFGVNIGEWSSACSGSYNIGTRNTATDGSVNIGNSNKSFFGGYCVGGSNKASSAGYSIGIGNSAQTLGVGIGQHNLAQNCGFCLGQLNKASANGIGIGTYNSAYNNSYCIGHENSAENGGYVFGSTTKATSGSICIGEVLTATNGAIAMGAHCGAEYGSIVMGARNYGSGCNIIFGTENNFSASNIIGHKNEALNSNIFGNRNIINKDLASNSSLSAEEYTKTGYNPMTYDVESANVFIRNFVAGLDNSAEYAKNAYILGNENKVICDSSADYLNVDNDGFTYLFGYKNSAARNYDMAIGYKSIASGGENIAIGAPFETIIGYDYYGYAVTGTVNTQARGYKNIAIRSTITGINNIAYNSTLTGDLMNLTSTWVNEELSKVVDNQIKNTWVSGTTSGNYATVQKNIINNAKVTFSSYSFNNNRITNTYELGIFGNFSNNTILNSNNISLSATVDEYSNSNNNTIIGCENFGVNSKNIVDNLFLNITAFHTTANRHIKDNILIKTTVAPCSSMSSINENIVFNSLIYGNDDSAYRGWGTSTDSNTTFTRNFIFGTNVGNYIYNTFSFSDNSNGNSDYYRLSNTIRTFNFGDNGITKAENSFVFGLQNTATSIGRSFVFGYTNNLYKAPTDSTQDYIMDAFVFGICNNLINECTYSNPTLENTTIFGQHNYIKSKNTCSYNYIVGLKNSITYFTDIPSKSSIINNIDGNSPEYETNSAAFQTTRNRIFGNGIKLTHGITDSFVAGISNYVIDTKEYPASAQPKNADYNSIYMFGVANVAYDGSHQLSIGYNNETSGHFAEAIGDGIKSKEQQLIVGKCNADVDGTNRYSLTYNNATSSVETVEPSGVIFAIGNGTYDYTTGYYTNQWGNRATGYLDKNNNVIPDENINNEEYITRSNALIVSANGVVSANDYKTSAGYVTELIQRLEDKITALETIISSNSANWVLTSQA